MKRYLLVLSAFLVAAWFGVALAGAEGNVKGKVTKIDGDMWTIEMTDGKSKTVHVDPSATKKEGDLKVGTVVSADVTSGGHANWIKADAGEMKGEMKH
jgi:hypothetical protein